MLLCLSFKKQFEILYIFLFLKSINQVRIFLFSFCWWKYVNMPRIVKLNSPTSPAGVGNTGKKVASEMVSFGFCQQWFSLPPVLWGGGSFL
jgi:hypothetical protein